MHSPLACEDSSHQEEQREVFAEIQHDLVRRAVVAAADFSSRSALPPLSDEQRIPKSHLFEDSSMRHMVAEDPEEYYRCRSVQLQAKEDSLPGRASHDRVSLESEHETIPKRLYGPELS